MENHVYLHSKGTLYIIDEEEECAINAVKVSHSQHRFAKHSLA